MMIMFGYEEFDLVYSYDGEMVAPKCDTRVKTNKSMLHLCDRQPARGATLGRWGNAWDVEHGHNKS